MSYKFNGGNGAIICEKCRNIIETGLWFMRLDRAWFYHTGPVDGKQIYLTSKAGDRLHYCGQYCCYRHNTKYRKDVDSAANEIIQLFI